MIIFYEHLRVLVLFLFYSIDHNDLRLLVLVCYALIDLQWSSCRLSLYHYQGAVVVPQGALGGEAVLSCIERFIPLIIVSNQGVLNVSSTKMRLDSLSGNRDKNILYAENYIEAAGLITALRHAINVKSLRRPIDCLKQLNDE